MAKLMAMGNYVVHVAVKNDVKESRSTLVWALRNLGAKKVCILHVYQPKTASPAARKLEEPEAIMYETLHDYFDICQQEGCLPDVVFVSGFGRRGPSVGDIHGVGYKFSGVSISPLYKRKEQPTS
ncbi:unnamed protein product [Brassica oleracea var. botrytis]